MDTIRCMFGIHDLPDIGKRCEDYNPPRRHEKCKRCGAIFFLGVKQRFEGPGLQPYAWKWRRFREVDAQWQPPLRESGLGRNGKWQTANAVRDKQPCAFCLVQRMLWPSPKDWTGNRADPVICPDCPARHLCEAAPDQVPHRVLNKFITAEEGLERLERTVKGLKALQVPGRECECDPHDSEDSTSKS